MIYLGDGVYYNFDGFQIKLVANNNIVYINDVTFIALIEESKKFWQLSDSFLDSLKANTEDK